MKTGLVSKVAAEVIGNPGKASRFAVEYAKAYRQDPNLSDRPIDRTRSLMLTFSNSTSQPIELAKSYFSSGVWFSSFPATISPNQIVQGFVTSA